MFPSTVADGNGGHWTCIESFVSKSSAIGASITDEERDIKQKFVRNHSNEHFNIVKRTKVTPSKSPKLLPKWGRTQTIFKLKCNCDKAMFMIRRKEGLVCVYQKGNHSHHYGILKVKPSSHGLPSNLKEFLVPFVGQQNAMKKALTRLSILNEESQLQILAPYEMKDLGDTSNLKSKIKNFLQRRKARMKSSNSNIPVTASLIGPSQSDLSNYLLARKITVEELAQYCRYGNTPPNKLWIVYEDVSTNTNGRFTHITFMHSEAIALIQAACIATATRSFAFQSEIDYTHLDSDNGLVLGVVGTSDAQRHFHPIIYDLNVTENSVGSTRLLKVVDMLTLLISQKHVTVLKDASLALEKASSSNLNLETRDCLTHKVRSKSWNNRKSASGTRGSLETYMMNKSCKTVEISQLLAVMLALDTLPSVEEYQEAIELLYKDFDIASKWSFYGTPTVKEHIKTNYFPLQPRIGPIHMPLEVHSSNGLERKWHPTKQTIQIYQREQNLGLVEATLRAIENRSIIQWTSVTYKLKPKSTIEQWDAVRSCAENLPASLRHMLVYSNLQKLAFTETFKTELLNNLFAREEFQTLRIYIPSWKFLEKLYAQAAHIDLQNVDEDVRKWLRKARNGKELSEPILSSVAANVGGSLYKMNKTPLEIDDVYAYLKRHGQRGITLFNNQQLLPSSPGGTIKQIHKRIRREQEQKQEYEKWLDDESLTASKKKQPSTNTPNGKQRKNTVKLKEKDLGSFLCVSIQRGRSDAVLDAVDDGYILRCTCEAFRTNGTCFETKLFGWILLDRQPEKDYLPHQTSGLDEERKAILEVLRTTCCRPSQLPLDTDAPLIDPVHSK